MDLYGKSVYGYWVENKLLDDPEIKKWLTWSHENALKIVNRLVRNLTLDKNVISGLDEKTFEYLIFPAYQMLKLAESEKSLDLWKKILIDTFYIRPDLKIGPFSSKNLTSLL